MSETTGKFSAEAPKRAVRMVDKHRADDRDYRHNRLVGKPLASTKQALATASRTATDP